MAAVVAPLVVIVGPTASGKTGLAIKLAQRHSGEIICADSRTIYKHMDIGTAKPTIDEQQAVPHWGIDLVEPDERFTAADFQKYANDRIHDIREHGRIPFLVGGTGLYIDSILFGYEFGPHVEREIASTWDECTLDQLVNYCKIHNIQLPQNQKNRRYIIRAIEQGGINHKRDQTMLDNTIVVGLTTDKAMLRDRIVKRTTKMFNEGVVDEAATLSEEYGWENEAMTGNIYPILRQYLDRQLSLEDAKQASIVKDWHLAKRQMTWFRRNTAIHWLDLKDAEHFIDAQLFDYEQKYATV